LQVFEHRAALLYIPRTTNREQGMNKELTDGQKQALLMDAIRKGRSEPTELTDRQRAYLDKTAQQLGSEMPDKALTVILKIQGSGFTPQP
jgi:hypothetical protein